MLLKVNLQIFLLSEREGKHNSFSMVDLPGNNGRNVCFVVVLCSKNLDARNRFLTGKIGNKKTYFRFLSLSIQDFVLLGIHYIRFINRY